MAPRTRRAEATAGAIDGIFGGASSGAGSGEGRNPKSVGSIDLTEVIDAVPDVIDIDREAPRPDVGAGAKSSREVRISAAFRGGIRRALI